MKLVLVVLCVAAAIFLLRVLAALLKESMLAAPPPLKAYLSGFQPRRPKGELVVIQVNASPRRFSAKVGSISR
jgi:hypothetical protein